MGTLPRVVTSPEHTLLERDGQWGQYGLWVDAPTVIFTARVNGAPASTDRLAEVAYDGGSGTLANVLPGMTLWVGSSAGAWDKGQLRIRKTPTTIAFYVGEESELSIADNDYLTVVDEFGLWAKHPRVVDNLEQVDYDVVYTDQHTVRAPVPVLGPPMVGVLRGVPLTFPRDASGSWEPGGATLTYSWAAPTASATSGLTTATPTMTFNTTGRHRISCTVTNGAVSTTGYRFVRVFGPADLPVTEFAFTTPTGAVGEGGYSFTVTMFDAAQVTAVRDRAQVVLFGLREFYGASEGSLGYVAGGENIVALGWIDGQSIDWNPEQGLVTFTVRTANAWLQRLTAFPQWIFDTVDTPTAWTFYLGLTVPVAVWHLAVWRSTLALMLDVYMAADTRRAERLVAPSASLWAQLGLFCQDTIMARPCCDRYSRLFIAVDAQLLEDRSAVAEVMTLNKSAWTHITLQARQANPASMVDLSGTSWNGLLVTAYFALSPGHVFGRYGQPEPRPNLLLASQAQALALAGLVYGQLNNPYPAVTVTLAANNRFLDVAPCMYATLTIATGDTEAGIAGTFRMLPRRVTYTWNAATGTLLPEVEFEAESFQALAVVGDTPPTEPTEPGVPPTEPEPPPEPGPWPGTEGTGDLVYCANTSKLGYTANFKSSSPNWSNITGAITGTIKGFVLWPYGPKTGAYVISTAGVFRCFNLNVVAPVWEPCLTMTAMQTATGWTGCVPAHLCAPITESGGLCVGGAIGNPKDIFSAVTQDYGDTWEFERVTGGDLSGDSVTWGVRRVIADLATPGTYYICQGLSNRAAQICKTTNYGASWSTFYNAGAFQNLDSFDFNFSTTPGDIQKYWFVQRGQHQIYRSTNYGASFSLAKDTALGPPPAQGLISINVATLNPLDVLWADPRQNVGLNPSVHLWRSYDAGATWPVDINLGDVNKVEALGRWPFDAEKVFMLYDNNIIYSENGGVTRVSKVGDWASVMGAAFANPVMIVPVWVA